MNVHNHDNEPNVTHLAEICREQVVPPLSYSNTRPSPRRVGGEGGPGNYWVPVYANIADLAPALVLWFFDSRGGMSFGDDPKPMPDYVEPSVADWIKSETLMMETVWGSATTRGALAFVHIPPNIIPTLQPSLNNTRNHGLNSKTRFGFDMLIFQARSSVGAQCKIRPILDWMVSFGMLW
ncbi:hypothetical protein C8J56DRAFT_1166054 [Mycena floridula]|nr:hypothetical protein C8J56DRAFT_1166054 [Mycena floridula]